MGGGPSSKGMFKLPENKLKAGRRVWSRTKMVRVWKKAEMRWPVAATASRKVYAILEGGSGSSNRRTTTATATAAAVAMDLSFRFTRCSEVVPVANHFLDDSNGLSQNNKGASCFFLSSLSAVFAPAVFFSPAFLPFRPFHSSRLPTVPCTPFDIVSRSNLHHTFNSFNLSCDDGNTPVQT